MRCVYDINGIEYIVEVEDSLYEHGTWVAGPVHAKFLCRVNGGKGRLPTDKGIDPDKLKILVKANVEELEKKFLQELASETRAATPPSRKRSSNKRHSKN